MSIIGVLSMQATITHVVANGPVDEYGSPTTTTTTSDAPCYLSQNTRREVGRDQVEHERWTLFLLPEVEIDANDIVSVSLDAFQVVGPPWRAVHPLTGEETHIEVTLERTR